MKKAWKKYVIPNLFYIVTVSMLLPIFIHALVLVLTTFYLIWERRTIVMETFVKNKWLSVFLIYVLIVSLMNQNYMGVLVTLIYFIISIYFSSYLKWVDIDKYLKTLNVFVIGSIYVGIYAIFIYLYYVFQEGYTIFYVFQYSNVQTRAESTFFNPNYYGLFCVFAIIIGLYLLFKPKFATKYKYYYYASFVINIVCILLTASRMVLPTVAVALVWFIFWTYREYVWYMIGIALVGVVALVINPDLIPRFSSIVYAFEDRFALWDVGWRIFMSSPFFGRGAMSYMNLYYLYTDKSDMHAHQLFINSLADFGIIGIGLIVMMMKDYFRSVIHLWKQKAYRLEFSLVSTMILTVFVHGLVDVSIHWTQTAYVLLAVILPIQQLSQDNEKS